MNNLMISASISCMNQCYLKDELNRVEKSDVSFYHYDVVDGKFNRCFILGETTLKHLRKETSLEIEVHLAVYDPQHYIEPFIQAGADYIAVHYEAMNDPLLIFKKIRELGAKPILAYRAETPPDKDFIPLASKVDGILKLTVNPGFSGQKIQMVAIEHIKIMRKMLNEESLNISIQADGNVNLSTIPLLAKSGANIFTGGSSGLFIPNTSIAKNCKQLLAAAKNAIKI